MKRRRQLVDLIKEILQAKDYPWPSNADQVDAIRTVLRNATAISPTTRGTEKDLTAWAISSLSEAALLALDLVQSGAVEAHTDRQARHSTRARVDVN